MTKLIFQYKRTDIEKTSIRHFFPFYTENKLKLIYNVKTDRFSFHNFKLIQFV